MMTQHLSLDKTVYRHNVKLHGGGESDRLLCFFPSELRWQRELLLHTACQMVVGCQDELWQWAVPAAVAIVVAMEVRRKNSNHRSLSQEKHPAVLDQHSSQRVQILSLVDKCALCFIMRSRCRNFWGSKSAPLKLDVATTSERNQRQENKKKLGSEEDCGAHYK